MTDDHKTDGEQEIELHNLRLTSIDYPEDKTPAVNPDGTINVEMSFDYTAFMNGHLIPTKVEVVDNSVPKPRGAVDFMWHLDSSWAMDPTSAVAIGVAKLLEPYVKDKLKSLGISPEFLSGEATYAAAESAYTHIGTTTLSWPEVKDAAVGYAVYTAEDLRRLARERAELRHLRKLLNKRKKQARARTGRRR